MGAKWGHLPADTPNTRSCGSPSILDPTCTSPSPTTQVTRHRDSEVAAFQATATQEAPHPPDPHHPGHVFRKVPHAVSGRRQRLCSAEASAPRARTQQGENALQGTRHGTGTCHMPHTECDYRQRVRVEVTSEAAFGPHGSSVGEICSRAGVL